MYTNSVDDQLTDFHRTSNSILNGSIVRSIHLKRLKSLKEAAKLSAYENDENSSLNSYTSEYNRE